MRNNKLLLLLENDYLGIARSVPVVTTSSIIFRINDLAERRNGGVTLFSPNQFFHDTIIKDVDDSHINDVLSIRLDDNQYYTQGI